jgi:hypothetical protein
MRILYLHDNQLIECPLARTNLEYLTLFDNPLADYRRALLPNNPRLLALDCHVVTPHERATQAAPRPHTQLKWPIVEISQELEQEEDYLNLLKAELFVVGQVHKQASFTDRINDALRTLRQCCLFHRLRLTSASQALVGAESARKAAQHWVHYTAQRQKLRRLLAGSQAAECTLNRIERARVTRSQGVGEVVTRFVDSVRARLRARVVLSRALKSYRLQIPVFQRLEEVFGEQRSLYFLSSQLARLEKVLLYARKLLFNQKDYDLCDNFDRLVCRGQSSYFVFRQRGGSGGTAL